MHVDTTKEAAASLDNQASQFVKLCMPIISVASSRPNNLAVSVPTGLSPTRPVKVDGFYTSSNRCEEVLSHDNVTIGAGGVAITPFLSMVPAILSEFGSKETEEIYTKAITLHWACREEGLMSYVIQNYLKVFQLAPSDE